MGHIKKRALTLIELIIAMTLAMVLTLAVSYQFVAMIRLGNAIKEKAEPTREAYIVMNHMTNMLRLADPGSIEWEFRDLNNPPSHERLHFTLNGTTYYYKTDMNINNNNRFYFSTDRDAFNETDIISRHVGCMQCIWDPSTQLLTIKLRLERTETSEQEDDLTIQTTIKVLGT